MKSAQILPQNVTTNAKDRRHIKTMTESGIHIQNISTKRTDKQADRVLLLGQVTEKKEKANPSHFLKFLLASRTLAHLVLPQRTKPTLQQNQKSQFPTHPKKAVVV